MEDSRQKIMVVDDAQETLLYSLANPVPSPYTLSPLGRGKKFKIG